MTRAPIDFSPTDANRTPRFAEIATFMRTKTVPMELADEVNVGVVGVPFDLGSSYRAGSRHGPAAIREASRALRLVNGHTGVAPFEIACIADLGDAKIHPLNFDQSIEIITQCFLELKKMAVRPLVLGGDHTISLPILRGLVQRSKVGMVHFDAHSDTSDETRGMKISQATPFRRAVEEGLLDPERVVQIGLRGQLYGRDDYKWARSVGMTLITIDDFEERGRSAVIDEIRHIVGIWPTYVSFDIDCLDAVFCPGTGVPEPGGISMRDALVMLRGLRGIDLIGADICEVSPHLDVGGITSLHAAHLGFEMLCLLAESSQDLRI
ncbi:agmatinase [Sinorhizobium meliloti]|uniref:agmatinase n=1 Tax=Rhizobium meliloti TaxID=382 RepID=UPI000FDAA4DD|nr:agmatinase [Sinorhizobium meliloti]RVG23096.1 agmatinase [Sinorhizobium meliloti]RVL00710.1 agmatinase [Sinorhizobium meliloti]RVN46445.1 agmatinase [Sinorhizobium meliloti]